MGRPGRHSNPPSDDIRKFHAHISSAKRILVVCGAGLSASSGIPTYRGAGGMWRKYKAAELATYHAFARSPGVVWQFYAARRHDALLAQPNNAHHALAAAAKAHPNFLVATQNIDGLSARAEQPVGSIVEMHGSLFCVKCDDQECGYKLENDFRDPVVPAFAGKKGKGKKEEELVDVPREQLPHCLQCKKSLLRPGVVWFGEKIDEEKTSTIDGFIAQGVDLCLVIGTSGTVYPAASYGPAVMKAGGKVAIVDLSFAGRPSTEKVQADWAFEGDAAVVVPELLRPLTDADWKP